MTANPPGADGSTRTASPRVRRGTLLGAALAVGVLAGCGSGPGYQYVANGDRSMVVKVPTGWVAVDNKTLGVTSSSDAWQAYYDGSGAPDADHFETKLPISPPDTPAMRLLSVKTDPGTQVPDSELRDLLTPNNPHELVKFARQSWLDDVEMSNFAVLSESTVDTGQAHGVRIRSAYAFNVGSLLGKGLTDQASSTQQVVVVDKIAVASKDGRHVHVIQVWCSLECFRDNQDQIDEVLSSYTVKLQP